MMVGRKGVNKVITRVNTIYIYIIYRPKNISEVHIDEMRWWK